MIIIKKHLGNNLSLAVLLVLLSPLLLSGCFESGGKWGSAPDFTLITVDGETFNLSEQLGKIVVIDFMYVECRPCQLEMDELKHFYEQFMDEIIMISISVWWAEDKASELQGFKDHYQAEWMFALDTTDEDATMKYNVISVPRIVIINKTGDVTYTSSGWVSHQVLTEEINKIS